MERCLDESVSVRASVREKYVIKTLNVEDERECSEIRKAGPAYVTRKTEH